MFNLIVKKYILKFFVAILFLLCAQVLYSQSTITLNKAIEIALQNNLEIQIAQNETEIARNNNSIGNAGLLPNISLNASENPALTNINQKFTNGTEINRNNVFSHALNANILATYTLFDGKRYAIKQKLELGEIASNLMLKNKIQEIINQVIVNYSNIIKQQKYLTVLKQLSELSKQRLTIVITKKQAGLANNTDLYLAELENENIHQNEISQMTLIKNAYSQLNTTLNIKLDSSYILEDFKLSEMPLLKQNLDSLLNNNLQLLLANNSVKIAQQTEKEISAARLPNIKLSGAYNYNLAQSQAGFSLLNQNYGPQAGINLSIPLFNGYVNQRNYANAQVMAKTAQLQQQLTLQTIQNTYLQAWLNYSTALEQLKSDNENIERAKKYIDLMQLRFKAGESTIIELKEAQRTFEDALYSQINNQYITKLAESQLLYLTNGLVK